jgi:hypothetical protein
MTRANKTRTLSLEELRKYFVYPFYVAVTLMGIDAWELRRQCCVHRIYQWPYKDKSKSHNHYSHPWREVRAMIFAKEMESQEVLEEEEDDEDLSNNDNVDFLEKCNDIIQCNNTLQSGHVDGNACAEKSAYTENNTCTEMNDYTMAEDTNTQNTVHGTAKTTDTMISRPQENNGSTDTILQQAVCGVYNIAFTGMGNKEMRIDIGNSLNHIPHDIVEQFLQHHQVIQVDLQRNTNGNFVLVVTHL